MWNYFLYFCSSDFNYLASRFSKNGLSFRIIKEKKNEEASDKEDIEGNYDNDNEDEDEEDYQNENLDKENNDQFEGEQKSRKK